MAGGDGKGVFGGATAAGNLAAGIDKDASRTNSQANGAAKEARSDTRQAEKKIADGARAADAKIGGEVAKDNSALKKEVRTEGEKQRDTERKAGGDAKVVG